MPAQHPGLPGLLRAMSHIQEGVERYKEAALRQLLSRPDRAKLFSQPKGRAVPYQNIFSVQEYF